MPSSLRMLCPPRLVQVRDVDGALRRALLVARRDDRCFLQVTRSPGENVLRWLPAAAVRPPLPPARTGNPDDAAHSDT